MKEKMKTLKRALAFVIAVMMIAGSVKWGPLTAKAEETSDVTAENLKEGTNTPADSSEGQNSLPAKPEGGLTSPATGKTDADVTEDTTGKTDASGAVDITEKTDAVDKTNVVNQPDVAANTAGVAAVDEVVIGLEENTVIYGETKEAHLTAKVGETEVEGKFTSNSVGAVDGKVTLNGNQNVGLYTIDYTFTPTDTNKYQTCSGTVSYTVEPKKISVTSITLSDKTYDGTTTVTAVKEAGATIATGCEATFQLDGIVNNDTVTVSSYNLSGNTNSKNIGEYNNVSFSGEIGLNNSNYTLGDNPTLPKVTVKVVQKKLTLSEIVLPSEKEYDGTTEISAEFVRYVFDGFSIPDGDDVTLSGISYNTGNFDVGENVNVTVEGLDRAGFTGTDAGNYELQTITNTDDLGADKTIRVLPKEITVFLNDDVAIKKKSDGNTGVKLSSIDVSDFFRFGKGDIISNDEGKVTISSLKASASDSTKVALWAYSKDFGTGLDITGMEPKDFNLSGDAAGNYQVSTVNRESFQGKGEILPIDVTTKELDLTSSGATEFDLDGSGAAVTFAAGIQGEAEKGYWYNSSSSKFPVTNASFFQKNGSAYEASLIEGEKNKIEDVYIQLTDSKKTYGPCSIVYNYDKTDPVIKVESVEVSGDSKDKVITEQSIDYAKETINYEISVEDTYSGVNLDSIQYYVSASETLPASFSDGDWKSGSAQKVEEGKMKFSVAMPASGYLFVRASDNAANQATSEKIRALVIEADAPKITLTVDGERWTQTNAFDPIDQNSFLYKKATFYAKKHEITLKAVDPETVGLSGGAVAYSGIQMITYKLTKEGGDTPLVSGTIKKDSSPANLADIKTNYQDLSSADTDYSDASKVQSLFSNLGNGDYNGSYTLHVEAHDNCGNASSVDLPLNFDNTVPEVTVGVSGTGNVYSSKAGDEYWYSSAPQISVKISDEHLDAADGSESYQVVVSDSDDTTDDVTVVFTPGKDNVVKDSGTGLCTYEGFTFNLSVLKDGVCTITVTAVDAAGNSASEISEPEGITVSEENPLQAVFYLDTTKPKLKSATLKKNGSTDTVACYSDTDKNIYTNETFSVTYVVEEANYVFDRENTRYFEANAGGTGGSLAAASVENTDSTSDPTHTIVLTVDPKGQVIGKETYRPYLSVMDKAGNSLALDNDYDNNNTKIFNRFTVSGERAVLDSASIEAVILDTKAPEATIEYTPTDHYYDEGEGKTYAYYNKANGSVLKAAYSVAEENFDSQKVKVNYQKDGILLTPDYMAFEEGAETLSLEIPIEDNAENHYQFAVYGEDKAGNALKVIEKQTTGPDGSSESEKHNEKNPFVSVNDKVIDTIAPTYTLSISSSSATNPEKNETYGNRYYFDKEFETAVTFEETNFDKDRVYVMRASLDGSDDLNSSGVMLTENFNTRISCNGETCSAVDTVRSGDGVYRYQIYGMDKAGNALKAKTGDDQTSQNLEENPDTQAVAKAAGLSVHVVMDTQKPVINVNVKEDGGPLFYAATLSREGKYSSSLNSPYRSKSKARASVEGKDFSPIQMSYEFTSKKSGSGNSNASYEGSVFVKNDEQEVGLDGQQTVRITKLTVTDLAGNKNTAENSIDGAVSTWMYLDTTPPNYDNMAPSVALKVSGNTTGTTKGSVYGPDGNNLYTGNVTVSTRVTDPGQDVNSSGLYKVFYEVKVNGSDWTGRVKASKGSGGEYAYGTKGPEPENPKLNLEGNETLTFLDDFTFTFDANTFNYNDVVLTVWAQDNAGNIISEGGRASVSFGIDITKPTVRVTYDNNSALNEMYFKEDRVATIEVTERNFDESETEISTEAEASIGSWSHSRGSADNGDEDVWTCEVTYSTDGDYTFDVTTKDLAGNEMDGSVNYGDSAAPQEFVLDKTLPVITVSYNTNSASHELYYNTPRVATLQIEEHNFNPSEVEVTMTATDNGAVISTPSVVGWSDSGDTRTAHISYDYDGEFTFDVAYIDKAGNEAADYTEDHFIVDLTEPAIEIVDIVNLSANNGTVAPGVNISDTNYDADGVEVTFTGYNNGAMDFDSSRSVIENGQSISFADIPHVQDNDDLYTLTASASDLAGNVFEDSVTFSVNRFGSVYILSEATQKLIDDYYSNEERDLMVEEINVDTLEFQEITYSKDGDIVTLEEGADFTVQESGNEATWKSYTYTIGRENFETEGAYTVTISSEDRATNKMNNKMTSKDIEFVIDKTAPSVVVTGVENGAQYNADSRNVTIDAQDNIRMDKVFAYINGNERVQEFDIEQLEDSNGLINIPLEGSNDWQTIRVVSQDAAGNRAETDEIRFLITSNVFYQWYRNTPVFYGTVGGVSLAGLGVWAEILLRRRQLSIWKLLLLILKRKGTIQ